MTFAVLGSEKFHFWFPHAPKIAGFARVFAYLPSGYGAQMESHCDLEAQSSLLSDGVWVFRNFVSHCVFFDEFVWSWYGSGSIPPGANLTSTKSKSFAEPGIWFYCFSKSFIRCFRVSICKNDVLRKHYRFSIPYPKIMQISVYQIKNHSVSY